MEFSSFNAQFWRFFTKTSSCTCRIHHVETSSNLIKIIIAKLVILMNVTYDLDGQFQEPDSPCVLKLRGRHLKINQLVCVCTPYTQLVGQLITSGEISIGFAPVQVCRASFETSRSRNRSCKTRVFVSRHNNDSREC